MSEQQQDNAGLQALPAKSGRVWLAAFLVMSALGLAASVDLSILHWQVHNVPGHVSFCAINDTVNCDTVAMSKYSLLFGIPISVSGVLFYLMLMALAVWGLIAKRSPWPWGLVSLFNAASVGLSVYLFLLSKIVIHSFCVMCICLYAVNLISAVLCILAQRKVDLPVRGGLTWLGLAVLAPSVAVPLFFPDCSAGSWSLLGVMLGIGGLLLVGANVAPGARERFTRWWRAVAQDLKVVFAKPLLGGGLCVGAAAVVVAVLLVVPSLYAKDKGGHEGPGVGSTCDEPVGEGLIAGGTQDIGHGVDGDGWHWIGAEVPQVTIYEYSDYECPFCRKAHEIVRVVVRQNKEWVRLVHVQMPLDQKCNRTLPRPFHRHACDAALGTICAAEQDAFWPMNDRLFLRRGGLDPEGLTELAGEMGLDSGAFAACMQQEQAREVLDQNLAECSRLSLVPATPTFRVGPQIIRGLKDQAWWSRAVEHFRQP
jgi:uncharacterized membrane protein/protein-disulfide isomerase